MAAAVAVAVAVAVAGTAAAAVTAELAARAVYLRGLVIEACCI